VQAKRTWDFWEGLPIFARILAGVTRENIVNHMGALGQVGGAMADEGGSFFTYSVVNNSIGIVEASFHTLDVYATLALFYYDGATYTKLNEYVLPTPIDRPPGFTLEVDWRHTLNATHLTDYCKNTLMNCLDESSVLAINTMGIVHSAGTALIALYEKSVSSIPLDTVWVVSFKASYPATTGYSNISTIQLYDDIGSLCLFHTISPFDKPSEAELIIEFRNTISRV